MTKNYSSLEAACGPESLFLIRIYYANGGLSVFQVNFAVAAKNYVTVYITGRLSVVDLLLIRVIVYELTVSQNYHNLTVYDYMQPNVSMNQTDLF